MPLPEKQLISRIRALKTSRNRALAAGIGDDCAVLRVPRGREALVTTDFSLEGVHFRREWHPAEVVGHRCLTRGLSDIAAMGGEPIAAFLSLALPPDLDQKWVDGFLRGFNALARKFGVTLAGGDTAQSPTFQCRDGAAPRPRSAKVTARRGTAPSLHKQAAPHGLILADVMVLGSVPQGKAVLRSGARVGDDIYVTGKLGMGVAALNRLFAGEQAAKVQRDKTAAKHFRPTPRLDIGQYLREHRLASAMIDISDGLSTDLAHICEESGVSAWVAEEAMPIAVGATLEHALHGGDEYELIFTARPEKHKSVPKSLGGVPITWIGTVTRAKARQVGIVWLVNNDRGPSQLKPQGWEHFKG